MDVVFGRVELPPSQVVDKAPKSKRDHPPMIETLERRLWNFNAPHDDALKHLLGRKSALVYCKGEGSSSQIKGGRGAVYLGHA